MADDRTREIIRYYDERVGQHGTSGRATLLDENMRLLELETACAWLRADDRVLDIFCGNGVSTVELARHCRSITGVDLSERMIETAAEVLAATDPPVTNATFRRLDVLELDRAFSPGEIDTVVSIRGLINLPSFELQAQAIRAIHALLPRGGRLVFLEGSRDGLERINELRTQHGLEPLAEPWYDKHFDESELFALTDPLFEVEASRELDTYFLVSRVLYPLAARPEEPRFDHLCNEVARLAVPHLSTDSGATLLICRCLRKR